jgi:hypothetical protein
MKKPIHHLLLTIHHPYSYGDSSGFLTGFPFSSRCLNREPNLANVEEKYGKQEEFSTETVISYTKQVRQAWSFIMNYKETAAEKSIISPVHKTIVTKNSRV